MSIISLNDYRKERAAIARPSPSVPAPVNDKTARHRRHRIWLAAIAIVRFREARMQFHHACCIAARDGYQPAQLAKGANAFVVFGEEAEGASTYELMQDLRAAIVQAIRTPAPTQSQILWKKRQLKDVHLFGFIAPEEARACIAADEAFHRANPVRKSKGAKS